jgi:23S rRNA pseudouridine1911/1915/1917 synthase
VRLAHTSFQVLARGLGISMLKAILHTGRTHQIRAQLADIDHPLLGDALYGQKRSFAKSTPRELVEGIERLTGQALHAECLAFLHPITKEALSFQAPLPEPLASLEKLLCPFSLA